MTFLLEIIRLGLSNLRLHKLRSLLTSLGIILGVAAVILMVSIGEGNKQAALRSIQALGASNIIVRSAKPAQSNTFASGQMSMVVKYGLSFADFRRIEHNFPDAEAIVPLKAVASEVSYSSQRDVSQVFGTTPQLIGVTNLRLEPGSRYLTDEDMASRAPVAVIGSEIAKKLFRLDEPIGAEFRIDDRVFRVVGVLRPVGLAGGSGSALVGRDLNRDVHIPLTTAEALFGNILFRRTAGQFTGEEIELSEVYVTAPSTDEVTNLASRVERVVRVEHPDMADVQMIVPWELIENAKKTQLVWDIVLIAVAAISLLVGGIGIMNIMLASVTERTREIGIRRALGATRRHITAQFLVETGTLSTLGGLLGIVLGVSVSVGLERVLPAVLKLPIVARFVNAEFKLETQVTGWSIIASFIVAASIGLIFGLYPAIVASRKDPIVALRHD
ncbi:MAG: ABC transporter permease [Phycisphaeraceae bacterium]|nr:ABC transporter permease [Phycisphaerales bacterium]QOJ17757.1 MAG: ABC transporter permease [Phycisphaeraceae bacterium]